MKADKELDRILFVNFGEVSLDKIDKAKAAILKLIQEAYERGKNEHKE